MLNMQLILQITTSLSFLNFNVKDYKQTLQIL